LSQRAIFAVGRAPRTSTQHSHFPVGRAPRTSTQHSHFPVGWVELNFLCRVPLRSTRPTKQVTFMIVLKSRLCGPEWNSTFDVGFHCAPPDLQNFLARQKPGFFEKPGFSNLNELLIVNCHEPTPIRILQSQPSLLPIAQFRKRLR
jgi:hypothetical protein